MKAYIETTVTDFAKNAMSDYIEETVTNRAIPAFQDGLKPVQRKILWAMYKMGLFYNLSHKKSAKVTGEVIAKYNPHGDCLSGDTKIYATDGNIYEIKDLVGKELEVWCWDKETNSIVSAKAENFRTVSKDNLYTIEFSNGTTLKASGNHPILLENGTYCSVENLKENTPVYGGYLNFEDLNFSKFLFVKKITKETGSFTLYDFTVPKYENMMVMLSNHSFLIVHNSSAYMAMGNMAQAFQKYNFIDGQGNWGAWSGELPAASRYTECRLSELAQTCLLDKDYLKVVPMVDNYDGTEKEPAYLPARLPFILLLNISGIATAVRTGLPSFDLKALTEVCIEYLKTGKMKTDEIIPITTINGGKCISTKEEQLEFYKTGSGVLKFQPSYIMGKDRMIITGVQDDFNFEKVSDNLLDLPEIKSVKDEGSTEIKIGVYFKGNLDQKALDKIISKTQTKCIYSTNILINKVNEENVPKAKYRETNIYSLIKNWCKFRVGLEIKHLKNQICEISSDLKYQNTLLLAGKNLDIIFQSLKDKDPKSYLLGKLRCSEEEIDIILNLAVKRLSRLSTLETEKKIADLENQKSDLQKKLEKPEKEVIKDLSKLKEKFG